VINKVSITRKDLARGIDSFSAKGSIPEGFAEDLQNVDTNANGRLATRPGYEGYRGWVPLRVREVRHAGTKLRFLMDEATTIDLDRAPTGPIIVAGRLSEAPPTPNDWGLTGAVHYYPYFVVTSRDPLLTTIPPAVNTLAKAASDHAIDSRDFWVGITRALDQSSQSNRTFIPDAVRVDTTTFDVEIDYQINVDAEAFVYFREASPVAGQVFTKDVGPVTTASIAVAEHQLDTFNIIVKCFDTAVSPGDQTEVFPSITIDGAGTVDIDFDVAFTGRIYLEAVPADQAVAGSTATGINTIEIQSPGSPFLFFAVYRFNTGTGKNESVIVDNWVYDEDTDKVTVTYELAGPGESVDIYWTAGRIISNVIEVEDTGAVSTSYTDTAPQLTLWGIDHAGIYRDSDARGGHVNHIDSYRRVGEARVICGLGGNIFQAATFEEASASYLMGTFGVNLRGRLDQDAALAPLFHTTDPGAVRTRGLIWDAWVSNNRARCSAATFVSPGVVDYTLEFSSKSGTLVLGTQVDTNDFLTVDGLQYPEHSGSWRITQVTDLGSTAVIRVANPQVLSARLNTAGARGRAGVFTDRITLEAAGAFGIGDRLLTAVPTALTCSVVALSGADVYLDGVTTAFSVADGTVMYGERTSDLLPLRDLTSGEPSAINVVRGDMLRVSGLVRRTRVLYMVTSADLAVTFTGTGSVVTGTSVTPHRLTVGQKILLRSPSGGGFEGYATITSIPSALTFTFSGTTSAGSATLVGAMAQVDEPLTLRDSSSDPSVLTVDGRWLPVEAPDHEFDMPPSTYRAHFQTFAYDSQPILRSTMVSDTLYFVNQADEVMKFDGDQIYRAGLPRWHAGLFLSNDTTATPAIAVGIDITISGVDDPGHSFLIDSPRLSPGDHVYHVGTGRIWIVVSTTPETVGGETKYRITVRNVDDVSGLAAFVIRKSEFFKYMVRLSLVDANDNVIVSTPVQSKDLQMEYVSAGQIKIKLLGMPDFGIYDYSRIQIEVFRSKATGEQRFLIHRQALSFDNDQGYTILADDTQDSALEGRIDLVADSTGLGSEIGTAWDQPPRAKHISSANGRLVLANLVGYPEVQISLQPAAGSTSLSPANLNGKTLLFRRDATDLSSDVPNLVDRVSVEFMTSGAISATVSATTATTFTVTPAFPTGAGIGDWVYLFHSNVAIGNSLAFAGWYQVADVSGNNLIFNSDSPPTPGTEISHVLVASQPKALPVWLGDDGNFGQRDYGVAGDDIRALAAVRASGALNAAMRIADRTLSGQEDFRPWLSAVAGGDYTRGTLIVSQPLAQIAGPGLKMPSSMTGVQIFVNDLLRTADAELEFPVKRLGSYAARSYRNYPELFDNPLTPDTDNSDSVIPINPADGQEITAMIPFFGTSAAGGASQLEQSMVFFKTNSIYLVDIETRAVTRIDSRGLGCTAPRSVASSRNGIVFANESGVFMLTRSLEVVPVGQALTNLWRDTINRDQLSEATGHHYGTGRRYKLSVPTGSGTYCSGVLVYDYEREGNTFGAWTRYTNHPVTGWCNLGKDAFFASQAGDVFLVRNRGEASDFRDEDQAVAEAVITLRAEDFDLPGVRKLVTRVISLFELELSDLTDVAIAVAADLSTNYVQVGAPAVSRTDYRQITLAATPTTKRGTQIQVRYMHQQKDQQLVLTAVVFTVGQLNETLIKQTRRFEED